MKIAKVSSSATKKFFLKASKWGDREAILINGAGKTLLAPLVILFNPFIGNVPSYKKENKAYMGLKQHTSGVVNFVVQMGSFLGVSKGLDIFAKKGTLGANYLDPKHLGVLKNRGALVLALLTMPLACAIANKLYSHTAKKFLKDKTYA